MREILYTVWTAKGASIPGTGKRERDGILLAKLWLSSDHSVLRPETLPENRISLHSRTAPAASFAKIRANYPRLLSDFPLDKRGGMRYNSFEVSSR